MQVRRLPVGDAIWIARHKYLDSEYVLDFIVERKKVDDLRSSIRDNRYKDQKVKLLVVILLTVYVIQHLDALVVVTTYTIMPSGALSSFLLLELLLIIFLST